CLANPAPTGVDIDGDGDKDLAVGNIYGNVRGYRNDGAGNWQRNDFCSLSSDYSYRVSSFFDLDFDTDYDLFCGINDGTVEFYKNSGDQDSPVFATPKISTFANIDVGGYASPCFGDVNLDKTQDLLIGRSDGRLSYFRNEGSYGSLTVHGKKIAYILDCKKTGSLPINNVNVVVEDLLPIGIDFETYTVTGGVSPTTFNQASQLLTWNFGNLDSAEYSWKITVIGSVTGASSNTVTNVATITPISDISPINNYSSATSHIIELVPDVWVSKRHLEWGTNNPPSEAPPGGYINYNIEYGNIGLLTAPYIKIVDTLPSGTTYLSSSPSGNVQTIGTLTYVTWDFGSLPPKSGTRTIALKVLIASDLATDTTLLNIASITTGGVESALNFENNLSTWTTIVKVPIIVLVI
ncbi:MAG: FG-GAP-like repeat-containing protein, partial [Candidatus Desantisbacteria bacterium]